MLCAVTLGLLCVSALVSGAETSFFSLSHKDIRRLQTRTTASAEAVLHLLTDVDVLLATILVVNNLVNICIVILVSGIIDSVFTFLRFEFLFKTVLVTFLLLLFGEILPKVLAQTMPVRFAQFAARPLRVLRWIFYPLSYILVRTSSRISEKAAHKSEISLDELADAVDMTQSSSPEEHVMLSGIVNFVNTEVQEIMKPRVDITALSVTDDYETVKQTIIRSGFSRIPVYEEDIDNIRGTLYVKDLLPYINHGNEFGWQQLVRKPYFVPEHKKINDLLGDFQSNKVHMAIVVDEYGSTLGLVSLEDRGRDFGRKRCRREFLHASRREELPLRRQEPPGRFRTGAGDRRGDLCRREGRCRDPRRADARTQTRLPPQGRCLYVARHPFYGAGDGRAPCR